MDASASPDLEVARAALTVSRDTVLKQQADVRELRVVAAALLTGTSVAVSFLGGRALDSGKQVELAIVGLVFFVGSLLAIIRVLLPGVPITVDKQLQEIGGGSAVLKLPATTERPRDVDAHERLSVTYDSIYLHNKTRMRPLYIYLAVAAVLLVLEVVAWGLSIGLARNERPATACVPATIAGTGGCLQRGQRCERRYAAQYERFGFICTRRAGDGRARLR